MPHPDHAAIARYEREARERLRASVKQDFTREEIAAMERVYTPPTRRRVTVDFLWPKRRGPDYRRKR